MMDDESMSDELMAALDEALTDKYSHAYSRRPVPVPQSRIPDMLDIAGVAGVVGIAVATGWYLDPAVDITVWAGGLMVIAFSVTAWTLRRSDAA